MAFTGSTDNICKNGMCCEERGESCELSEVNETSVKRGMTSELEAGDWSERAASSGNVRHVRMVMCQRSTGRVWAWLGPAMQRCLLTLHRASLSPSLFGEQSSNSNVYRADGRGARSDTARREHSFNLSSA